MIEYSRKGAQLGSTVLETETAQVTATGRDKARVTTGPINTRVMMSKGNPHATSIRLVHLTSCGLHSLQAPQTCLSSTPIMVVACRTRTLVDLALLAATRDRITNPPA